MRALGHGFWTPVLVVLACQADTPSSPVFDPEVMDQTDDFSFRADGLLNVTRNVTYVWTHTGVRAQVTQASQLTAGMGRLMVHDDGGAPVYSGDLSVSGAFTTAPGGMEGLWTIRVSLVNVSGSVSFRLQRGT